MHTSVILADCRVSCHAATRWFGMRATAWLTLQQGSWQGKTRRAPRRWVSPRENKWARLCTVNEHPWCFYWHLRCHSGWHLDISSVRTNTLITGEMSHTPLYWKMNPNLEHKERYLIIIFVLFCLSFFCTKRHVLVVSLFLDCFILGMHALHRSTEQVQIPRSI